MTLINHLQIKNLIALESLENNFAYTDPELTGIEPLRYISESLRYSVEANDVTSANKFVNVFGLDVNFFYIIESVDKITKQICYYERGIACVYTKDNKYFLNRLRVFVTGKNGADFVVCNDGKCQPINADHLTLVYSSTPPTYLECLGAEHTVLCSSLSTLPLPVAMKKNSLLARFEDVIQSVNFDDNVFVNIIINIFTSFTKQLKLKTSKLSIKRAECENIDLIPSSNIKAKRGSLYYDESSDTIKVYNGTSWKTLAFVKE